MKKTINKTEFFNSLRDSGYVFEELPMVFTKADNRVWGILISPKEKNLMVFHYKNRKDLGDEGFDIISDKRNYFNIPNSDIFDAVDQILAGGKYSYE